jgi:asparagine synthase (glutamine-hydrolysing)
MGPRSPRGRGGTGYGPRRMCGITGFFRPRDAAPLTGDERAALRAMNGAIVHRGPDDDGFYEGPGVGLAMRRLSIIDVAGSQQPQLGPSGQTACVFNGEIYNFRAVRDELVALGHTFRTAGDTEVLPHGYEQWGMQGLLERLNGMFAFAIFDARTRELLLARDRMGIKPLYVGTFGDTWVFGSELKAVLPHPAVRRDIDVGSLARYLALEYVPSPRSIYRDLGKLEPAHFLRIGPDGAGTRHRYWDLTFTRSRDGWTHPEVPLPPAGRDTYTDWAHPLLHALREAVRARLVSEVPIGALLSGGVDSSAISALMAELVPGLRTFSIGFDEPSFDESHHAQAVAAHIGSAHTARTFRRDLFGGVLDDVRGFLDEPFADASILPTHFLSRTVKEQGVTVVLSGDGADELFAGYPTYLAQTVAERVTALPGAHRLLGAATRAMRHVPSSYENVTPDYMARRFLAGAALPAAERHATFLGAFTREELPRVLSPDACAALDPGAPFSELVAHHEHARDQGGSLLERLTWQDLRSYMGDDILVKVDRASMATSLEVRTPFLDHRVVEMAARIPPHLKLHGRDGKYILKRAIRPRLPDRVVERRKKGFGMPVAKWLHGPWRELLLETLGEGRAGATGLFSQPAVDRLIDEHLSGQRDRRKPLWTLLMFQWWHDGPFGPGGAR